MTSFQDTPTKLHFFGQKFICYIYTCEASLSSRDSSEGVELSFPLLITVLSCTTMPAAPPASLPPFLSSFFSFLLLSKYSSAFAIASELVWESEDVRPFTRSPWKEGKQRNFSQPNTSGLVEVAAASGCIAGNSSFTQPDNHVCTYFIHFCKEVSKFLSVFCLSFCFVIFLHSFQGHGTEVKNLHARRGLRKCLFTT